MSFVALSKLKKLLRRLAMHGSLYDARLQCIMVRLAQGQGPSSNEVFPKTIKLLKRTPSYKFCTWICLVHLPLSTTGLLPRGNWANNPVRKNYSIKMPLKLKKNTENCPMFLVS